ncbi:MAG: glycogen synthase GlgA [Pseudomonadota bacterium]
MTNHQGYQGQLPRRKTKDSLHVLHVVSEVAPFSKTGGLADAASALPRALVKSGARVTIVTPRYSIVDCAKHSLAKRMVPLAVPLGSRIEQVALYEGHLPGGTVRVFFLDHPFYARSGYYSEGTADYPDNGLRFGLLCRGALELCRSLDSPPDVVHAHDWQGGLALLFARQEAQSPKRPATVMTIHNLAFLGLQPRSLVEDLGLDWNVFTPDGAEFYEKFSCLKAGISSADVIATVSPRYAREIQTPKHGAGLDGFLRARANRIVGILNGVDVDVWSSERDLHLPARYGVASLAGKSACKAALQAELGLATHATTPLVAFIGRLTEQKGFGLLATAADDLMRLGIQLVFLASGEATHQETLLCLQRQYPRSIAVRLGHDEPLAHRIFGGADMMIMPSRFEPCGLNQLYALRYGAIPIVRAVGGLDDTVVDYDEMTETGNGFKFEDYTPQAVVDTLKRAVRAYQRPSSFQALVQRAMQADYSWDVTARRYLEAYERAIASQRS